MNDQDTYQTPRAHLLPLFSKIDALLTHAPIVIAIDGGSASGKSTLAADLAAHYHCNVFHIDDFFLQPHQRTAARLCEIGGNFDRERFLEEVLQPLKEGGAVTYRRFDCKSGELQAPLTVAPHRLAVVEGAYAMHPSLAPHYDLSVFLDVAPSLQKQRIQKRNTPEQAARFFGEWIPKENAYFAQMQVKERCDLVLKVFDRNDT